MIKRGFVRLIEEICQKNGWRLETFCDEWIVEIISVGGIKQRIIGYSFPLNNQVASLSANDKGLTSQLLQNANLPHVDHSYVYGDVLRSELKIEYSLEEDILTVARGAIFPMVVKPNKGTQGRNVFLCQDLGELVDKAKIISKIDDLCVSPYEESEFEYRFYFLNDEILLAYKKKRHNSWKHNLSEGSIPEILDLQNYKEMEELAKRSYKVLGLRMGAVDIFETKEGPKVLEINNGISLVHFAEHSEEYKNIALNVYEKYLSSSFEMC